MVGSRLRVLLLLMLTGVPAAVEAAVLLDTGFRPSLGLSVLATAPAPYGSLHHMGNALVSRTEPNSGFAQLCSSMSTTTFVLSGTSFLGSGMGSPRMRCPWLLGAPPVSTSVAMVVVIIRSTKPPTPPGSPVVNPLISRRVTSPRSLW